MAASTSAFDIVEFYKTSSISIFPTDYLKLNPTELDKMIQYVNGGSTSNAQFAGDTADNSNAQGEPIFVSERDRAYFPHGQPIANSI